MSHVLIVDDEPSICWAFREFLTEEGHEVSIAASAEEALAIAERHRPDAVVMDVRLPGMDGLTAMECLNRRIGDVPVIVITAFGSLETAVQAIAQGAFDYLPKPFDLEQAAAVVQRALASLRPSVAPVAAPPQPLGSLVGSSAAMQRVFKQIALVAASDVPVLITGESGTGKELVARAIHRHSPRAGGPFVPVSLAAFSAGLVESELFGHVRGAFTGSTQDRPGVFELAQGGTVLLDEIADISVALQVKLLRAIEQREILPVGDARPHPTNLRILAATNRPLPELIAAGEFREDLYFRLSVFHIPLPPLRERRDDISLLAQHFLRSFKPDAGERQLSAEVCRELSARSWVGNVRELRNAIEHAVIVARGDEIRVEHLPLPNPLPGEMAVSLEQRLQGLITQWAADAGLEKRGDASEASLYERFMQCVETPLLQAVLAQCGDNRAAAAERLGLHRATLRQKLKRYGIG
jgi:two-component system nitrogen regulation response regulator GlnG